MAPWPRCRFAWPRRWPVAPSAIPVSRPPQSGPDSPFSAVQFIGGAGRSIRAGLGDHGNVSASVFWPSVGTRGSNDGGWGTKTYLYRHCCTGRSLLAGTPGSIPGGSSEASQRGRAPGDNLAEPLRLPVTHDSMARNNLIKAVVWRGGRGKVFHCYYTGGSPLHPFAFIPLAAAASEQAPLAQWARNRGRRTKLWACLDLQSR